MKKTAKILLASLVCFLALGSGLFNWNKKTATADLPSDAMPEWLKAFPRYPTPLEGAPMSMGDDMMVNGLPMKMAYMRTEDSMRRAVDFYAAVWTDWGYDPNVTEFPDHTTITVMDNDGASDLTFLTANISDEGDVRTIMLTMQNLPISGKMPSNTQNYIFEPPVPAGAMVLHNTESLVGNLASASKVYSVPLSMADAQSYYHQVLPSLGFKLSNQATQDELDILYFVAGKLTISVAFAEASAAPPVTVVTINYLEEP